VIWSPPAGRYTPEPFVYLIIGDERYFSFADERLLEEYQRRAIQPFHKVDP
jgi:hypothetical protein